MKKVISILLADDEPSLRDYLALELKEAGFSVLLAENGEEAFDICLNQKVDFIVSDISMPGLSGFNLLKKLRLVGKGDLPVIFMTGHSSHAFDEFTELDNVDVLSKPFEAHVLISKIKNSLDENT